MEYCPYSKSRVPSGTVRYEPVWFGYGSVRSGTVRVRSGTVRVRSGTVGYGPVRSSSVGSVLFGFVRSCSALFGFPQSRTKEFVYATVRSVSATIRFGKNRFGTNSAQIR